MQRGPAVIVFSVDFSALTCIMGREEKVSTHRERRREEWEAGVYSTPTLSRSSSTVAV
jgi:hypothetical protein